MNKFMMSIIVLVSSASVLADEIPITYKCYIETENGADIANFSWKPTLLIEEQAAILAQEVSTMSGKRATVRHIEQCVELDTPFKSEKAKLMDEGITH